ncbi:hypothetical protein KDL45_01105 [bacterium]|nr:hypothetical protein [bacterium]
MISKRLLWNYYFRRLFACTLLSIFAVLFNRPAFARVIYWDSLADDEGWQIESHDVEGALSTPFWFHQRNFGGEDGNFRGTNLVWGYYSGYLYRVFDSTLISNSIPATTLSQVDLVFKAGLLAYPAYSVPETIIDTEITFGARSTSMKFGEPLIVLFDGDESFFSEDGYISASYFSQIPVGHFFDEGADIRFWWHAAMRTPQDIVFKFYLADLCLANNCSTKNELSRHHDIVDGYLEIDHGTSGSPRVWAVSCLPEAESEQYISGVRLLVSEDESVEPFGQAIGAFAIRSENAPGDPPIISNRTWYGPGKILDIGPTVIESGPVYEKLAMEPLNLGDNLCVGMTTSNYKPGLRIAYEDVGPGNSHSYVRINDSSELIWMDDKEFIFSAVTESDCDDFTFVTTTTTTSTTTTTILSSTTTTTLPPDDDASDDDDNDDEGEDECLTDFCDDYEEVDGIGESQGSCGC